LIVKIIRQIFKILFHATESLKPIQILYIRMQEHGRVFHGYAQTVATKSFGEPARSLDHKLYVRLVFCEFDSDKMKRLI